MSENKRFQQLLDYYRARRIDDQRAFYKDRADVYRSRDRLLRVVAGVLMLSTGLISTLAAIFLTDESGKLALTVWNVLPAIIPALATALLTMRGILQMEATQYLYRQTYFKLGDLWVDSAPSAEDSQLTEKMRAFVEEVESAIANENVQWLTRESAVVLAKPPTSEDL